MQTEYKNLNIIVVLVNANPRTQHQAGLSHLDGKSGQELDSVAKNLNSLARKTPEGYMVVIEQRQFEGREGVGISQMISENLNAGRS